MLEKLFHDNILMYTMMGIFGLGMLLKIVLGIGYSRMIRASNNMGCTNYKLLSKLKLKFETLYKLKINVNNVDAFVDKCINNHKTFGVLLITWERFSGQVSFVSCLIALLGALLGVILGIDRLLILSVFSVGFLTSGLLIFFEGLLNKKAKKEIIRLNILDYLENYLNNRLEQEDINPNLIDEYRRYFTEEGCEGAPGLLAATDEFIQIDLEEDVEGVDEKPSLKEKRLRAKENRKYRKVEKEATKLFKKQAQKAAKAKRKEDRMKSRLVAKKEKNLKKEEKLREVEIKNALKLEKKLNASNKKASKTTPAQQRKESLKKEIKELRQLESRNQKTEVNDDMELVYEYETVRNITGTNPIHENNVKGGGKHKATNNIRNLEEHKTTSSIKGLDRKKVQSNVINVNKLGGTRKLANYKVNKEVAATKESEVLKEGMKQEQGKTILDDQNNIIKRQTKLSKQDKQIIEDILKEYLA